MLLLGTIDDTNANSKDVAECRSGFGCRGSGDESVSESTAEQESRPNVQEDECAPRAHRTSPPGIPQEAHRVIPHQETEDGDSSVPDDLSHDVGKHKGGPVVSAAFAFPGYKSQQGDPLIDSKQRILP